jgi:hypothetical protein
MSVKSGICPERAENAEKSTTWRGADPGTRTPTQVDRATCQTRGNSSSQALCGAVALTELAFREHDWHKKTCFKSSA